MARLPFLPWPAVVRSRNAPVCPTHSRTRAGGHRQAVGAAEHNQGAQPAEGASEHEADDASEDAAPLGRGPRSVFVIAGDGLAAPPVAPPLGQLTVIYQYRILHTVDLIHDAAFNYILLFNMILLITIRYCHAN